LTAPGAFTPSEIMLVVARAKQVEIPLLKFRFSLRDSVGVAETLPRPRLRKKPIVRPRDRWRVLFAWADGRIRRRHLPDYVRGLNFPRSSNGDGNYKRKNERACAHRLFIYPSGKRAPCVCVSAGEWKRCESNFPSADEAPGKRKKNKIQLENSLLLGWKKKQWKSNQGG
jgi:hypothetical protein